jgi:hypothetical protein
VATLSENKEFIKSILPELGIRKRGELEKEKEREQIGEIRSNAIRQFAASRNRAGKARAADNYEQFLRREGLAEQSIMESAPAAGPSISQTINGGSTSVSISGVKDDAGMARVAKKVIKKENRRAARQMGQAAASVIP